MNFIALFATHFIADFALQSDRTKIEKRTSNMSLFIHTFLWTICLLIVATLLHLQFSLVLAVIILIIPHFIIDYIEVHELFWADKTRPITQLLLGQFVHAAQLILFLAITY